MRNSISDSHKEDAACIILHGEGYHSRQLGWNVQKMEVDEPSRCKVVELGSPVGPSDLFMVDSLPDRVSRASPPPPNKQTQTPAKRSYVVIPVSLPIGRVRRHPLPAGKSLYCDPNFTSHYMVWDGEGR